MGKVLHSQESKLNPEFVSVRWLVWWPVFGLADEFSTKLAVFIILAWTLLLIIKYGL